MNFLPGQLHLERPGCVFESRLDRHVPGIDNVHLEGARWQVEITRARGVHPEVEQEIVAAAVTAGFHIPASFGNDAVGIARLGVEYF